MNAVVKPRSEAFGDYIDDDRVHTKSTAYWSQHSVRPSFQLELRSYASIDSTEVDGDWISNIETDERTTRAISELSQYANLSQNWNGYGGLPFGNEVITRSQSVVLAISRWLRHQRLEPLQITPGPAGDGSIDIELGLEDAHVIFTIFQNSNRVNFYAECNDKPEKEHAFEYSDENLENLLAKTVAEVTQ